MQNQIQQNNLIVVLKHDFKLDFNILALKYPLLRKQLLILGYETVLNFKKQDNLIMICSIIMKEVFGLFWDCPFSNLCPRIPSRLNYLLWINFCSPYPIKIVLDIGTGASLIYPLIGNSIFGWNFISTQIDQLSIQYAKTLILKNKKQKYIQIRQSNKSQKILSTISNLEIIDITICNPPFFQSYYTGNISVITENQHHTNGGQYQFFFQLYRQSFHFPKIKIFTCLLGLFKTFKDIQIFMIDQLKLGIIKFMKSGRIQQGNNSRFIIMWQIQHQ